MNSQDKISQRIADGVHQAKEGCARFSITLNTSRFANHPRWQKFERASRHLAREKRITLPEARGLLIGLYL
jgi:hypothetical protein